jgi:hypothetical protein
VGMKEVQYISFSAMEVVVADNFDRYFTALRQ